MEMQHILNGKIVDAATDLKNFRDNHFKTKDELIFFNALITMASDLQRLKDKIAEQESKIKSLESSSLSSLSAANSVYGKHFDSLKQKLATK